MWTSSVLPQDGQIMLSAAETPLGPALLPSLNALPVKCLVNTAEKPHLELWNI